MGIYELCISVPDNCKKNKKLFSLFYILTYKSYYSKNYYSFVWCRIIEKFLKKVRINIK